jgi:hypothetical protein
VEWETTDRGSYLRPHGDGAIHAIPDNLSWPFFMAIADDASRAAPAAVNARKRSASIACSSLRGRDRNSNHP